MRMCSIAWIVSKHQISCWYEEFMKRNTIAGAYQKSHYHVQCVYCKIWIFIMLSGRCRCRYFELSTISLSFIFSLNVCDEKRMPFVCFTPFKFDLGKHITTDTHQQERVVYVLIQVLFCVSLNTRLSSSTMSQFLFYSSFYHLFFSNAHWMSDKYI